MSNCIYYFSKTNILVMLNMTNIDDGVLYSNPFIINMN